MTLEPLLSAPPLVLAHVLTVVPAAVLGAALLAGRKGTPWHKRCGRIWIGLMAAAALISLFIHETRGFYGFSLIHLLSLLTLSGCWQVVSAARRGDVRAHRRHVLSLNIFAILGAGLFTLVPGRRMHAVVFTGPVSVPVMLALGLAIGLFALGLLRLRRLARRPRSI